MGSSASGVANLPPSQYERGVEIYYVHQILRNIILGEDWRCDIWGGGGGGGVQYCVAVTRLWLTSLSISPLPGPLRSPHSTPVYRGTPHRSDLTQNVSHWRPARHPPQQPALTRVPGHELSCVQDQRPHHSDGCYSLGFIQPLCYLLYNVSFKF